MSWLDTSKSLNLERTLAATILISDQAKLGKG